MALDSQNPKPPLLEVNDLKTYFPVRKGVLSTIQGYVYAVDGVSITVNDGETLGLVGESGSGKSTLGKSVLRIVEPTSGEIKIRGKNIIGLSKSEMFAYRREVQMVFQDPYSSLNPRIPVGRIVAEVMQVHGIASGHEARERVKDIFEKVGLWPSQTRNYANEFSGGQRQRIGIARALALNPSLIIADEPVSALDVSVQAQVINLFMDLQEEFGISYLFIAHDLAVVAQICHRIAVMYLGRLVELADRDTLFRNPLHPYTQALLASIPIPNPKIKPTTERLIQGDIPSPSNPPNGCRFHTRCPLAEHRCRVETPEFKEIETGHWAACHLQN
jgi:peptide/nickel transport system ATP-binding protein/oligopeptide transport system ATP-binding protein